MDTFSKMFIDMYHKSDDRIKENNEMAKNEDVEDEDDAIDEDDLEVIKEENNNEYDLQLSLAEIMGILFKTHGPLCGALINELFTNIVPQALQSKEKKKIKFGLFVMDDMVEFLGPEILGVHYVSIAKEIIKFCTSSIAACRQAASYGIGVMAEKAGAHFAQISTECLMGLKGAIEYLMPANVQEKKSKVNQFMHSKDNAVSALGKIVRYQAGTVDVKLLVPNWLGLLPLKNDIDEAKIQNEFIASMLHEQPLLILGDQYQYFERIVILLSDIIQKKFVTEETGLKLAAIISNMSKDPNFGPQFQTIYQNKLTSEQQDRINTALKFTQ